MANIINNPRITATFGNIKFPIMYTELSVYQCYKNQRHIIALCSFPHKNPLQNIQNPQDCYNLR